MDDLASPSSRGEDQRELLAKHCHDSQWSGWMSHFFGKCIPHEDGSYTVPAGYADALWRQIRTSYEDLEEDERESDREEADRIIKLLEEA